MPNFKLLGQSIARSKPQNTTIGLWPAWHEILLSFPQMGTQLLDVWWLCSLLISATCIKISAKPVYTQKKLIPELPRHGFSKFEQFFKNINNNHCQLIKNQWILLMFSTDLQQLYLQHVLNFHLNPSTEYQVIYYFLE